MAHSAKTIAKSARKPARARVRKNMDIDPVKLARARKALGAASDTETVDWALDLVAFRREHAAALDALAAAGGLVDAFGREAAPAAAAPAQARGAGGGGRRNEARSTATARPRRAAAERANS